MGFRTARVVCVLGKQRQRCAGLVERTKEQHRDRQQAQDGADSLTVRGVVLRRFELDCRVTKGVAEQDSERNWSHHREAEEEERNRSERKATHRRFPMEESPG